MKRVSVAIILFSLLLMVFPYASVTPVEAQAERDETLIIDHIGGRVTNPTTCWNSWVPGSQSAGWNQLNRESLFYRNYATGELVPYLATGYKYSADYKSITITLRKGVKWNDGVPFTADDVVFTYDMLLKNAPKLLYSPAVNASVESVTKVDNYTVTLNLRTANSRFHISGAFPQILGGFYISAKHVWQGKDPLTFMDYPPVGTGPYKLIPPATETTQIWERRDDWWATEVFGVRPGPKRVIYTWPGPVETKAMKMAAHELDAVWQLLPGVIDSIRKTTPTVRSWSLTPPYGFPGLCPRHIYLNMLVYPWNILEVRRAVSYLFNRAEFSNVNAQGGIYPAWGPFPDYGGLKPYLDSVQDLIAKYEPTAFNVTKSGEIFSSLGFKKGADGIWVTPNGTRLQLTIPVPSWSPEMLAIGPSIAGALTDGGIDATAKITDSTPFSELINTGKYDGIFTWLCPGDSDPLSNLDIFHSRFNVPIGTWAAGDQMRYKNPEYDVIVDELRITSPEDFAKCKDLFRKAMEIYFRDVISIPLVHAADGMSVFDYHYWIGWPNKEDQWNQPWPHIGTFLLSVAGYPSPLAGGAWVKGIRPASIDFVVAYFAKDTPKFRGIDLTWYGPFKRGDAARIPVDDAEFWLRKGYVSYSPLAQPVPAEIPAIATAVEKLAKDVSDLKTGMTTVSKDVSATRGELEALRGQTTMLATATTAEGIAIMVLAVLAVTLIRRKPT